MSLDVVSWSKKDCLSDIGWLPDLAPRGVPRPLARRLKSAEVGFEHRHEAEQLRVGLKTRLARFGLNLHPDQTRLIDGGPLRYTASMRSIQIRMHAQMRLHAPARSVRPPQGLRVLHA